MESTMNTSTISAMRCAAFVMLLSTRTLCAQGSDARTAALFDRGDRRARQLMSTVSCAQQSARARRAGTYGAPESLGQIGQCLLSHGRRIGVFFDADSNFVAAHNVAAVDLATGSRVTSAIDTTALLTLARAEAQAHARAGEKFAAERRPYAAFAFRGDGDSTEVWLVPASLLMRSNPVAVGGERGFQFTPDGATLVAERDASAEFRTITVPDTGMVHIASGEEYVPLLSEFILANQLNEAGRDVSIDMQVSHARLSGRGAQAVWTRVLGHP